MDNKRSCIEQEGVVKAISNGKILVNLSNHASCASCHARAICSVSESDGKPLEFDAGEEYWKVGDHIRVSMQESLGFKALLLGYFVPFLVLMATLLISWTITDNELIAAITGLGSLIPYYLIIWSMKQPLQRMFSISFNKMK